MDIARAAIDKPVNTWIIVLICLLGGIWGLLTVGRLEDPSFTIKQAVVLTEYPGATAEEVEEEVTERLESAIQQMPQLDRVTSKSMPGMSEIEVEIKMTYDGTQLPQIWDELRRKVGDAQRRLPDGAGPSVVNDDFGDVFGIFYAVTTPGFSAREKREIAKFLRREVLTVPDVAKVATDGEREEAIYIEVSNERLASLGISVDQILATIQSENAAEPAGATRVGDARLRVAVRPGLDTVRAIEALRVGRPGTTEQLSLVDIAEITREPVEIPRSTGALQRQARLHPGGLGRGPTATSSPSARRWRRICAPSRTVCQWGWRSTRSTSSTGSSMRRSTISSSISPCRSSS